MAYKRRPYRRSFVRRKSTKRKGTGRRSYTAKKRFTRKPMSRRSILNTTSVKKRDTMMNWTNLAPSGLSANYNNVAATMLGGRANNTEYVFVWTATARDYSYSSAPGTGSATVTMAQSRTSTSCFMRGLKECMQFQTVDSLPWIWRRVCFTAKQFAQQLTPTTSYYDAIETSNGYVRVLNEIPVGSNQRAGLYKNMFRGSPGVDWTDVFYAPLDRNLISVKYDKVRVLSSSNDEGMIKEVNLWHPMNSTLCYGDAESGGVELAQRYSTDGRAGMGDYIVVDIFQHGNSSANSSTLTWGTTASLYWHER
uniref:Capsid protein n=1 Tax=Plant associated genomovirus 22 TaxID=2584394 RepID=A0A4Y5QCQ0_9VIRU|nr:capsid protein [Plant associated genomovirus 22]